MMQKHFMKKKCSTFYNPNINSTSRNLISSQSEIKSRKLEKRNSEIMLDILQNNEIQAQKELMMMTMNTPTSNGNNNNVNSNSNNNNNA